MARTVASVSIAYRAPMLGVTHEMRSAVSEALRGLRIILDTDAAVSFFCEHEPDHFGVKAVFHLAGGMNTHIIVPHAVAEETARHAGKSLVDYQAQVAAAPRPLALDELPTLKSAFTREFEYLRIEGRTAPRQWRAYINQFIGKAQIERSGRVRPDIGFMRQLLVANNCEVLPPLEATEANRRRIEKLRDSILTRRGYGPSGQLNTLERDTNEIARDKARIDAELVIAVEGLTHEAERAGRAEKYVLVTSSPLLKEAVPELASGLIPEILSVSECAFLATLVPTAPATMRGMAALLADGNISNSVCGLDARVLDILRRTSLDPLPGATRGVLLMSFRERLVEGAKTRGKPRRDFERDVSKDAALMADLVSAAVDAQGLDSAATRDEMRARIKEIAERAGLVIEDDDVTEDQE